MLGIFFLLVTLCPHFDGTKVTSSESAWRKKLGTQRYAIMRRKETEKSFMGAYVFTEDTGMYTCAACGLALFDSKNKYNAGNGWPSFTKPTCPYHVYYLEDRSLGWKRYEVLCRRCDGHLGHVFNDGPNGALRYTINSISLQLNTKCSK